MENTEKANEVTPTEEEIDKSPIYHMQGTSTDRSLFISQFDKEIEERIKIESINEGNYPSLDNRVNVSYLVENENYFGGGNGKDISLIEECPNNKINPIESQEILYENKLPSKTELSIKDNTCVSVNIKQSTFEISDQYINNASNNKLYEEKINFTKENINSQPIGQDLNLNSNSEYLVVEKCVVKDLIGSHKLYEIQFFNNNEKKIKCYRRYDNFDKFNIKLRRKYPYVLIPNLTPKNPLIKIISPDEDFYLNRTKGLNFFLNYIYKNDILSKSREFHKFTHDADFDEGFFNSKEDENLIYYFPESSSISDTFKNKIYGVFSGIFGGQEERKLTDDEILLRRMETHYKGIANKYKEIKNSVVSYLKTIKSNADEYKSLSSSCFYMKDTLPDVHDAHPHFKSFFEICDEFFLVNKKNYEEKGIDLEFKFDVSFYTFKIIIKKLIKFF
jgi:hypothetical protein